MRLNKMRKVVRLHEMILRQEPGDSYDIAKRLNVSRRHVFNLLEVLREMGATIAYVRQTHTYYYVEPFYMSVIYKATFGTRDNIHEVDYL